MQATASSRGMLTTFEQLATRAASVLRQNDMGEWTRAAPDLYPNQWSWDSAFIAIGFVHFDTRRAAKELLALFSHQWRTGKIPHIVISRFGYLGTPPPVEPRLISLDQEDD